MKQTDGEQRTQLYLIGYRGSGKSTVGRLVAETLQRPFIDTDRLIECEAGCDIATIFREQGETRFRDYEEAAIIGASTQPPSVIALGGGAILRDANRQRMRNSGWTVWLQASVEQLAARIAADGASQQTRPGLTPLGAIEEVRHVLTERMPLYQAAADWAFDTDGLEPPEAAEQICAWYRRQKTV